MGRKRRRGVPRRARRPGNRRRRSDRSAGRHPTRTGRSRRRRCASSGRSPTRRRSRSRTPAYRDHESPARAAARNRRRARRRRSRRGSRSRVRRRTEDGGAPVLGRVRADLSGRRRCVSGCRHLGTSPELADYEQAHPTPLGRATAVGRVGVTREVVHIPDVLETPSTPGGQRISTSIERCSAFPSSSRMS